MNDSNAVDRESLMHFTTNLLHLGERHRFVAFILEIERAPLAQVVAHNALKHHHCAVRGRLEAVRKLRGRDGIACDTKEIGIGRRFAALVRGTCWHRAIMTTADWG